MDFNKIEKKILEVLNNLETVKVSNAIKAQTICNEIEIMSKVVFLKPNQGSSNENRSR